MQLTVFERLVLLGILPREGNYLTLKLLRELREALSFTQEEHKVLKFQTNGATTTWDKKTEVLAEIPIGEKMLELIVEALKKKEDSKTLDQNEMVLYERFVLGIEPEYKPVVVSEEEKEVSV